MFIRWINRKIESVLALCDGAEIDTGLHCRPYLINDSNKRWWFVSECTLGYVKIGYAAISAII